MPLPGSECPHVHLPSPLPWLMQELGQGWAEGPRPGQVLGGRTLSFPGGSDGKEPTCSAGDLGSIPGQDGTWDFPGDAVAGKGLIL